MKNQGTVTVMLLLVTSNVLAGVITTSVKSIFDSMSEKALQAVKGNLHPTNNLLAQYLAELDNLLNQDIDIINSALSYESNLHSHISHINAPLRQIFLPFNFEILDEDFYGYFGLNNGNLRISSITVPPNLTAESRDEDIIIPFDVSLKDITIEFPFAFLYLLGSFNTAQVTVHIPSIHYKVKNVFGSHSPTCADVSFKDEDLDISDLSVSVNPISEYFLAGPWIKSALGYLKSTAINKIVDFRYQHIKYISCEN